jgi:hypothetical protein
MSYLRKDIGHSLCQSRCVLNIVYVRAQMFICVCVYSSKVLASEGQTAMISVIFVFYLFRRSRKIFLAKKVWIPVLRYSVLCHFTQRRVQCVQCLVKCT